MTQFPNIPGGDKLVQWFQGQPSFHDAEVMELADFSCQNVIAGLDLDDKGDNFRLILYPCFGIAGFIEAKQIAVDIVPRA